VIRLRRSQAPPTAEPATAEGTGRSARPRADRLPLYPRLLRLRHVRPSSWQRIVLGEGAFGVAVLLVLADLASAWTLLVLPVSVALVVKAHDGLAGVLARPRH